MSVIRLGTGNGQPSSGTGSIVDDRLRRPRAVVTLPAPDRARQGGRREALRGVGIVQPAELEWDEPLLAEIDGLLHSPI